MRNTSLPFCGYSGPTCCNATDDLAIQAKFTAMNIADASCASTMKSILCTVLSLYEDFLKYQGITCYFSKLLIWISNFLIYTMFD